MRELIHKVMWRRKSIKSKNRIIKLVLVRMHICQKLEGLCHACLVHFVNVANTCPLGDL